MKKLFFVVAVATLFFSCQKELEPTNTPTGEKFTFKASIENLATKADINEDNDLVWREGDKIGIYVNDDSWGDGKHQPFTLVGEGGSTTGEFAWDYGDFTNTNAILAFFPWQGTGTNHNNYSGGYMYFKLLDTYDPYTSGQMLTPLVAPITAGAYTDLKFKHAGAAVKLVINNLSKGAKSAGLVGPEGSNLWGTYSANPSEAEPTMALVSSEDKGDQVWLHFDAPTAASTPFTFLFPVPAGTSGKLTFKIYDKNDVLVWSRSTTLSSALNRADVLDLPALDITPYKGFDQISAWGICGTHNSWSGDTPMVTEVDGDIHIANDITFEANAEFKIRKDGDWSKGEYNWNNIDGTDGLEIGNDNNIKVLNAGTYDVILNTSTHKIKVVASDVNYPDAEGMPHHTAIKKAKDLGATETANCYIITAPGAYKIPVVKGNSTESAGTVGGVQLLWETYNNATEVTPNSVIAAVDYDDEISDYIFFKTPDTLKPGNALIAAKDDQGNIIWSWHIWIPETEIESSTYGYIYNHELMDRNLGALVAATTSSVPVESFGLHYEWGRKDPFVGARGIADNHFALVSGTAISVGYEMTVAGTIANPTVYAVYTEAASWGNWLYPENDINLWKDGEKTIYDPCPAGYRVPKRDSNQPLHSSDLSAVTGWSDNAAAGDNAAYFTLGNPVTVFPYGGFVSEGGTYMDYPGSRSFIWTSSTNSEKNGRIMDVRLNDAHKINTTITARGCSVRCVKIEEAPEPPAPDLVGATSVVLDGDFEDWSDADAISNSGSIKEWKFGSDADNLYFYFKIVKSDIIAGKTAEEGLGYPFAWRRYIYMGLDTDNNSATGAAAGDGGLTIAGCEAKTLVYPFRGYSTVASGTDGSYVLNGVDSQGYTKCPVSTDTGGHLTVYGTIDDNYGYLEVGIPRDKIGSPSAGKIKVQFSLSSNLTGEQVITIN